MSRPLLSFSSLACPSLEETQELVHVGERLLPSISQQDHAQGGGVWRGVAWVGAGVHFTGRSGRSGPLAPAETVTSLFLRVTGSVTHQTSPLPPSLLPPQELKPEQVTTAMGTDQD